MLFFFVHDILLKRAAINTLSFAALSLLLHLTRIKTLFHSKICRKKKNIYMFILKLRIGHCFMIHLTSNIIPIKWHSVRKKMVPTWSCLRTPNCELAWFTISSRILSRAQQMTVSVTFVAQIQIPLLTSQSPKEACRVKWLRSNYMHQMKSKSGI